MTPASIRNNNPGAQYPGPSARKFGATQHEVLRSKDGVHKIATFPTAIHGAAAMFDLLGSRAYVGRSIEAAITKWCGGYYVATYLKVLDQHGGVKASDTLTAALVRDPGFAIPLAKAMARQEAGRAFPLDDAGWQQAHAMAFGEAVAPAFAPDNDVPSPRPETRAATAVADVAKPAAALLAVPTGGLTWLSGNIPSIDTLSSWQAQATKLGELSSWGLANWKTVLGAAVVYGVACHLLPWLARERI